MKTYLMGWVLAGWLAAAMPAVGQTTRLDWAWTAAIGRASSGSATGSLQGDLGGNHVRATADGGAVVSGLYYGYAALGARDTLRTTGIWAGMLVKYTATGIRQWARSIQGPGEIDCRWTSEDGQGNLFCIVNHDTALPIPGSSPLPAGTAWYQYSAAGNFLQAGDLNWHGTRLFPQHFDRDGIGNLTVAGSMGGPSTIGGQSIGRVGGSRDSFVTKLGPNAVPLWVRQLVSTGTGGNNIYSQAVLSNGDVLVGGSFSNNVQLDPSTTLASTSRLGFLACYNGNTGALRWGRAVPVPVFTLVDPTSGQAYVAGEFTGTLFLNGLTFTASTRNLFIARLDATTGIVQTAVFSGGGTYDQTLQRISCQPGGAITLSGYGVGGADFGADLGFVAATPTTNAHYVLQINAAGMGQALYPIPVMAWSLAVGSGGNPYVLANPSSAVRFGRLPVVVPRGYYEIVLAHIGLVLGTRNNTLLTGLSAYPNPSCRQATVTISGPWPAAQAWVSDLLGRKVWAGALENGRVLLPTAAFPPGLYLVQATDGLHTAAQKLLIE